MSRRFNFHTLVADQISAGHITAFKISKDTMTTLTDPTAVVKAEKTIGERSLQIRSMRLITAFSSVRPFLDDSPSDIGIGAAIAGIQSRSIESKFAVRDRRSTMLRKSTIVNSPIFKRLISVYGSTSISL